MNRKSIMGIAVMFAFLLIVPSGFAYGPNTHDYLNDIILSDSRLANSNIAQIARDNRDCFEAGFISTDITVFYYLLSGSKYEATHSWSYQQRMLETASDDCERAFAFGIAAHLIQDSVSHNIYIPDKIRGIYLPNIPTHLIFEAAIEAYVINYNPDVFERTSRSLDLFETRPELLQKMQNEIYASSGIVLDVKCLAVGGSGCSGISLKDAIASPDGFYSKYFALPEVYQSFTNGSWLAGLITLTISIGIIFLNLRRLKGKSKFSISWILPGFFLMLTFLFFFGGLSAMSERFGLMNDAQKYLDMSIERTVEIFQPDGWNTRFAYDPTGFDKLEQASAQVIWVDIGLIIFIIVMYIIYRKFIRRKKKR